jgi:alkylated DNA repair protein (DNA oxidative demethylase)
MPRRRPPIPDDDLFAATAERTTVAVAPEVVLLRRFVATPPLREEIERISRRAPFRRLTTPGGGQMSVAMTNCGSVGWHSDASGYRYLERDPESGLPWPPMPGAFAALASAAATSAGFGAFAPDCCLINRYTVGAQMGTHRDFDELDMRQPIVSVSIGLPAVFVWHGARRKDPAHEVIVRDGDVLVWGGAARPGYHGVRRLPASAHPGGGELRFNLTFRRAR